MKKGLINILFIRDNGDIKPYVRKNTEKIKIFGETYYNKSTENRFRTHKYCLNMPCKLFEEGNPFPLVLKADEFINSTQDLDKIVSLLAYSISKDSEKKKEKFDNLVPFLMGLSLIFMAILLILSNLWGLKVKKYNRIKEYNKKDSKITVKKGNRERMKLREKQIMKNIKNEVI